MSIETIFPSVPFSETEESVIKEIFSSPIVKKYLRRMAAEDTKELLSLSGLAADRNVISNAHLVVEGKLGVISTLLSIGVSQNPASNEANQQ